MLGTLVATLLLGAPPAAPAIARVTELAVLRHGDPHDGPRVDGTRCQQRKRQWRCQRFTARWSATEVNLNAAVLRQPASWRALKPTVAQALEARLAAIDLTTLRDAPEPGRFLHVLLVHRSGRSTRVNFASGPNPPPAGRPHEAIASALLEAALESETPVIAIPARR